MSKARLKFIKYVVSAQICLCLVLDNFFKHFKEGEGMSVCDVLLGV